MFLYIVPVLSVTLTMDKVNPIHPIGSDVLLTCTVQLSSLIDVPVNLNIQLMDPKGVSLNATTTFESVSNSTSTATVRSFGRDNSGNYTCAVSANSTSTFVRKSVSEARPTRITVGEILV